MIRASKISLLARCEEWAAVVGPTSRHSGNTTTEVTAGIVRLCPEYQSASLYGEYGTFIA